jgi:alkylation response protein AidB-like acyl-CoA dehydrogenase
VIDHAMQAHGAGGLSDDFGLAQAYAGMRTLRIADGPDEVHLRTIARMELAKVGERMSAWRDRGPAMQR